MELAGEEFNWKEGLNDGINCGNRPKKWEMWEKFKKKNKTLWSESEEEREVWQVSDLGKWPRGKGLEEEHVYLNMLNFQFLWDI